MELFRAGDAEDTDKAAELALQHVAGLEATIPKVLWTRARYWAQDQDWKREDYAEWPSKSVLAYVGTRKLLEEAGFAMVSSTDSVLNSFPRVRMRLDLH